MNRREALQAALGVALGAVLNPVAAMSSEVARPPAMEARYVTFVLSDGTRFMVKGFIGPCKIVTYGTFGTMPLMTESR